MLQASVLRLFEGLEEILRDPGMLLERLLLDNDGVHDRKDSTGNIHHGDDFGFGDPNGLLDLGARRS